MPSELPAGWIKRRLTDVVRFPAGQVDPRELPYREQPLLAPDHVESGTGRVISLRTAQSQGATSGKYIVTPGDVVLSKIRPALRKVALAEFTGTCSADMYPLRSCPDVLPEFLQAVLLSDHFSLFAGSLSGRTGIPKVNRADLASYEMLIPPKSEQLKIVDVYGSLTEVERSTEVTIEKLQALRAAFLEQLLSVGHRPLSEVIVSGPQNGLYKPAESYGQTGTPIVRINSFSGGPSDLTRDLLRVSASPDEVRRYQISVGDLLVNRVNTQELVGRSTVVSRLVEPTVFESNIMRCKIAIGEVNPRFLEAWMSTSAVKAHFLRRAKPAVSQASINRSDVYSCPIPKLGIDEQNSFLLRLDALSEEVVEERVKLEKLHRLKQGLVDDLLSGRAISSTQ
ncbi:restriction endonuclease subunit S [Streptomyces sp. CA-142005]|uniref:restriction endonuclease subunit S n=1 Tax=Streptomyces sp. CA-142005 TaxID=3240052 RepID=UPI003D8FEA60